ncbi:EamA family transporter [Benzoatithermus flavus]|uniref:EamA family transporter n=1 Tax=Benzoatithermus flavus TaxID=3108223 RepID=A0ABU8XMW6_9PROT
MPLSSSPIWPGVPAALASALLFGASTPAAKLLLGAVDPWLLAAFLYLGAGLGLLMLQTGRRLGGAEPAEAPLRRADLPWLAAMVAVGGIAGPVLLMLGLTRSEASSAALLLNLEGLATMAIAWLWLREGVDRRLLLGAVAILAGAVVLSWRGAVGGGWGMLLIAGACLAWGIDNNLTRKLSSADPVRIATIKGIVAGSVDLALALVQGAALPAAALVLVAALIGLFGYGISLALYVMALRHLGAARAGAYFSTAPFVGAVVAVVLLGEPLSPQLVLAGGLMALGVWLHLTERHEHWHEHEALVHEHAHIHDEHHRHAHGPDAPPGEPHSHPHRHEPLRHKHPHFPDLHHRHTH